MRFFFERDLDLLDLAFFLSFLNEGDLDFLTFEDFSSSAGDRVRFLFLLLLNPVESCLDFLLESGLSDSSYNFLPDFNSFPRYLPLDLDFGLGL